MIDSGGFQIRTLGAKISAEDVIKIYELEKPDIGFILDLPSSKDWQEEFISKTYDNVKYMVEQKKRIPDTELLNVSHGFTLERRKEYYNRFKEFNESLDGWAAALIKSLPPIFNAWTFLYLYENDKTLKDKRFHFLGLTGNKNMPMVYYLGKLDLVKSISFDSTKYGREGIMSDMRNPSFLQERLSIGKNAKGKLISNKFCPCPVCTRIPMERMQKDSNFIILHNLFWEIKKFQFFDSFENAKELKSHIFGSNDFSEGTKTSILFIDYALEHGLEKAEIKFKEYFKIKNAPRTIKKVSEWF